MKNIIFPFVAVASFAFTACEQTTPAETAQHNQASEATADTAVVFRDGKSAAAVASNAVDATQNAAGNAVDATQNAASKAVDATQNAVSNAADNTKAAVNNATANTANAFDETKIKLMPVKFPEVHLPGITVRGNSDYQVYTVDETVLFDTDKSAVKPNAAATLNEIGSSIGKRFANKNILVAGFADSRGDAKYNMQLGRERANSVKNYLVDHSKLPAAKVNTESFGEKQPVATNATPAGRQENRRVEIVVRTR